MGYKVKIQKIERKANKTYYVNFPVTFAEAVGIKKGEEMEWVIEDRNTYVLRRIKAVSSFMPKK